MQREHRGRFISFEGGEGSGKTTQSLLLHEYLTKKSIRAVLTREPGGSDLGEELRILLKKQHNPKAELLLLLASRHDHVQNLILPNLESGNWVICDRFIDSTMCYQGLLKELGAEYIKNLHDQIIGEIWPNVTFLMDLPTFHIKDRIKIRANPTHYDTMPIEQHEKVRNGFLQIAKSFPDRIFVLDATKDPKVIHEEIVSILHLSNI
jgi:dTMP kinase